MKATGIIRRIDDLGRIVIPKEIKNRLNIENGDPLEIFVENNDIILKNITILMKLPKIAQTGLISIKTKLFQLPI